MPTIGEGLNMGAEKLTGQALAQLAALAKAISDATKRFRSQQKKRGKVTRWGKLLKTIFPGFGHVVDLALDRYAQDRYNLIREKDKAKIREAEGFYTGKEGTKFIDALQEQEDLIDVNFGEAVASEVADYAKSWAGQQMLKKTGIGSITEKLKSNLPKWMTFGIPGGEGEDLPHGLKDVAGEVVMEKTDLKDISARVANREKQHIKDIAASNSKIKEAKSKVGKGNILQRAKAKTVFEKTKNSEEATQKKALDSLNEMKGYQKEYEGFLANVDTRYNSRVEKTKKHYEDLMNRTQKTHEKNITGVGEEKNDKNKRERNKHEKIRAEIQEMKDKENKRVKEVNAEFEKLEKKVKGSKQYKDEQAAIKAESKEYAETEKRTGDVQETAEKKVEGSIDDIKESTKR